MLSGLPSLPSVPVIWVDYPFFTTSTHLPVFIYNISTHFVNSDFQFLLLNTGKIHEKLKHILTCGIYLMSVMPSLM